MATKLTALKTQRYAGRIVKPGQNFDVDDRNVKLLIALGRAKYPDEPKVEPKAATYQTRDMVAKK